jgi:hypothetical protein
MPKQILYLDQNFVSNLAKVENSPDWKDSYRTYFEELLAVIRAKVNQNRLACPTSPFHREESEQSDRVKSIVWYVVEELSQGLSFHYSTQIFHEQIASASYAYCGKEPPHIPQWAVAFNKDPFELVEAESLQGQILVHLESSEQLIENYRSTTNLVADIYGEFKANRRRVSHSFEQEVDYLKYQLLIETFLPPQLLLQAYPQLDDELGQLGSIAGSQEQRRMSRILMKVLSNYPDPSGFWGSQQLLNSPFLKIRASLMAADIFFYPDKTPTPSLNTDFDIVATALPYVDLLATDNHMAELIRQAKLSQQFSAQVYSMNQRHQLLEALRNL